MIKYIFLRSVFTISTRGKSSAFPPSSSFKKVWLNHHPLQPTPSTLWPACVSEYSVGHYFIVTVTIFHHVSPLHLRTPSMQVSSLLTHVRLWTLSKNFLSLVVHIGAPEYSSTFWAGAKVIRVIKYHEMGCHGNDVQMGDFGYRTFRASSQCASAVL